MFDIFVPLKPVNNVISTTFPSLNWLADTRFQGPHATQDPMSAVILDDGFSMLTGEDVKKRCGEPCFIPRKGQRVSRFNGWTLWWPLCWFKNKDHLGSS